MGYYEALGVRRVINVDARLTRLGGSLMPEPVLAAMQEAACSYVDMFELQHQVGRRLAALTGNEATYVCTGAAAGLFLSALACSVGSDLHAIARLPDLGPCNEIIIHRAQRIPYLTALQLSGVRLVEVGNVLQTFPWELEAAISEHTAAVVYIAGAHLQRGALPLDETIRIAHGRGVPVIVDAAAQLPPPENLWHFTRNLRADLAIFSGGKDLCGPQASGMILGRTDLIAACAAHGAPHQRFGRPMKVGKEEMVGLLTAVEHYLDQNHVARSARFERTIADWAAQLSGLRGISAQRGFPNEAGQPIPRLLLALDAARAGLSAAELRARLWDGAPRVAVGMEGNVVALTPDTLAEGEEQFVIDCVRRVLVEAAPILAR